MVTKTVQPAKKALLESRLFLLGQVSNNAVVFWLVTVPLLLCMVSPPDLQNDEKAEKWDPAVRLSFLSADDKANVSEVLRVKTELGEELWPGFGRADIPIIFYNERYELLVGEPVPPPPWTVVEDDSYNGKPYHRRASSHPQSFAVRLGRGWAASISTQESMNRSGPVKITREYYVLLVHHEMFHAYQALRAGKRFARAGKTYEAAGRYPAKDPEFTAAWNKEGELLGAALKASSDAAVRQATLEFLKVRDLRRAQAHLNSDLLAYERELEWLEGLAKYFETRLYHRVSAQASGLADSSEQPALSHWYQADSFRLGKRLGHQEGDLRFYLSGMAQARLLDRLSPVWKERVMQDGAYLDELLRSALE